MVTRGGATSLDAGRFGTEGGVITAGDDAGAQKKIPAQITRNAGVPIVVTYSLFAATDATSRAQGSRSGSATTSIPSRTTRLQGERRREP